jgi:radical SAM enzyme (rSAM/lipoprotein system)
MSLNIFSKYKKAQAELHELSYLFWECTLRCNASCLHCGSDCHSDSSVKDMPFRDFLNVTESLKTHYNPNKTMIVLTGGEPLMRKDLEEFGKELHTQGYPWGMVTNGALLNKQRLTSLISSGLRSVTVSLDGFEESHNWLRGTKNSWEKAVNAIKLIVNENDLVYDVVTCVNQKNFSELSGIKDFLIELGVKKWRIFTIFPIGRAAENPFLDISNEQFLWLMDFLKNTRAEGKILASYGCEGFLGAYDNKVRDNFFFCRAGVNIASVLADGSISACPNINHNFIQGNIYTDNFLDVWNNRFEVMRNREWAKKGICSKCKEFKWCAGNGMHLHDPQIPEVLRCHYKMLLQD